MHLFSKQSQQEKQRICDAMVRRGMQLSKLNDLQLLMLALIEGDCGGCISKQVETEMESRIGEIDPPVEE